MKCSIEELQDHFDGRSRLNKAKTALKCYPKDGSIFYSYVDGWGKKQYVNIPIEREDLLPIIDRYLEAIGKDIERSIDGANINRELTEDDVTVIVDNKQVLEGYISDYKERYPTYTSFDAIVHRIKKAVLSRHKNGNIDALFEDDGINNAFQIEVCSDWPDKIYLIRANNYRESEDGQIIINVFLDGQPCKF